MPISLAVNMFAKAVIVAIIFLSKTLAFKPSAKFANLLALDDPGKTEDYNL